MTIQIRPAIKAATIVGASHFGLSVGRAGEWATVSGTKVFFFLRPRDSGMVEGYTRKSPPQ